MAFTPEQIEHINKIEEMLEGPVLHYPGGVTDILDGLLIDPDYLIPSDRQVSASDGQESFDISLRKFLKDKDDAIVKATRIAICITILSGKDSYYVKKDNSLCLQLHNHIKNGAATLDLSHIDFFEPIYAVYSKAWLAALCMIIRDLEITHLNLKRSKTKLWPKPYGIEILDEDRHKKLFSAIEDNFFLIEINLSDDCALDTKESINSVVERNKLLQSIEKFPGTINEILSHEFIREVGGFLKNPSYFYVARITNEITSHYARVMDSQDWVSPKAIAFKKKLNDSWLQMIRILQEQDYKNLFISERDYQSQLVRLLGVILPDDPNFKSARFDFFQCHYMQKMNERGDHLMACIDALAFCKHEDGSFIAFDAQEQKVLDAILSESFQQNFPPNAESLEIEKREKWLEKIKSAEVAIALLREFKDEKLFLYNMCNVDGGGVESVNTFYEKGIAILLSDKTIPEQRKALEQLAHKQFRRHELNFKLRLLADALMVIGFIFAGIGLVIGLSRLATGNSFFFSDKKPESEKTLIKRFDKSEYFNKRPSQA